MKSLTAFLDEHGIEYTITEGTVTVGGSLYLSSLTSIPEGFNPTVGGSLYLSRGLHAETKPCPSILTFQDGRYCVADGVFSEVVSRRQANGRIAWKLRQMNGDTLYMVERDGRVAHGDSIREAVEDLKFKQLDAGNVDDIVADICERGRITQAEYRLLTGACRAGLREGMNACGLDPDTTESVPLADVVRLSKGRFGGERIAELFGERAEPAA